MPDAQTPLPRPGAIPADPELAWARLQAEAEDLLKIDGRWIGDDALRNRRINAAYARLWLAEPRFLWAGLAAFASKQVGCGLLHATRIVEARRLERDRIRQSFAQAAAPGVEYAIMTQVAAGAGASGMARRLGFGNKHLFLDIYPLHRFYMEYGWAALDACLERRQNGRFPVEWQVDRAVLPFGLPFPEIRLAFRHIDAGRAQDSAGLLARHEQVNILQKILYDDRVMRVLLAFNQFAWATGFPSGDYQAIELTLSDQCRAGADFTTAFSRDKWARLWVSEQRMRFVLDACARFQALLDGPERPRVEASLRAIAA